MDLEMSLFQHWTLEITTKVTISSILDLSDRNSAFSLIFIIDLEWNDLNLKFNYLKENQQSNSIETETFQKMWGPKLNFGILAGTSGHPKVTMAQRTKSIPR